MEFYFDQGQRDVRVEGQRNPGELSRSIGAFYEPLDARTLHQIPGRTTYGSVSSAKVKGIRLCQFDSGGTDKLVALSGTTLSAASIVGTGEAGTFSDLVTGLDSDTSKLAAAHSLNRWYLATGYDRVTVLKPDGTTRKAGMFAPTEGLTASTADAGAPVITRADATAADSSGYTNFANSRDGDLDTFGSGTLSDTGTSTATWGWTATQTGTLYMVWRLAGEEYVPAAAERDRHGGDYGGGGGTTESGFNVTVKIEVSTDTEEEFSTVYEQTFTAASGKRTFSQAVSSAVLKVRFTLTFNSGSNQATIQNFDARVTGTSAVSTFTTSTGVKYAVGEFDENEGIPSPISAPTGFVQLTAENQVTLTLPSAARNTNSTHWRIYRTVDGGSIPDQLGLIAEIPITATTFDDDFGTFSHTEQPRPIVPLVSVSVDGVPLYFSRDAPPPALSDLVDFKGQLVGISPTQRNSMWASIPGRPDSWPEINIIQAWMVKNREETVALDVVGETLVIFLSRGVIAMDTLPSFVAGTFQATPPRALGEHPGCVGQYAKTVIPESVTGESTAVWVSPVGIHATNTITAKRLTSKVEWEKNVRKSDLSEAVLDWDQDLEIVRFYYTDTLGDRRFALVHMNPRHRQADGTQKITWGHYGALACIDSAYVDDKFIRYAGHWSDGKAYIEHFGDRDASNAYNTVGDLRLDVSTGRVAAGMHEVELYGGMLRHSRLDSGSMTFTVTAYRDLDQESHTVRTTVPLDRIRSAIEGFISGEALEFGFYRTGAGVVSVADLHFDASRQQIAGAG